MPEFLSPGIVITERPSGAQVIQGVSTSNMAIVGPTYRGPVDEATLATSFEQFQGGFGPLRAGQLTPISVAAFFANGGLRCYVTRVVASDAAIADNDLLGGNGNAAVRTAGSPASGTAGTTDAFSGTLTVPAGSRIVPGSVKVYKGLVTDTAVAAGTQVAADDYFGLIAGTNLALTSSINYATGAYSFTETGAVFSATDFVFIDFQTYKMWDINSVSKGAWGNGVTIRVTGDLDYRSVQNNPPMAAYSRYKVQVFLQEPIDDTAAESELVESFEAIDFDTLVSVDHVSDVVNDGSGLIAFEIASPAKGGPATLDGIPVSTSEVPTTPVPAAWAGTGAISVFTGTAKHPPIEPFTVRITALNTLSALMVVTDDGNGNLIGDVDSAGINTINYTTGAIALKFEANVLTANVATLTYCQAPIATSVETTLATGTDGSAAISRSVISSPTLEAPERGMFAFNKVDEILQLVIPDFAGDATILGDQIDYAENRKDVFVIGTFQEGTQPTDAVSFVRNTLGRNTSFAAMYYPWIKIADPLRDGRTLNMPPLGHVAGIIARTDNNRNVGKAPAGTIDGALRFSVGLERQTSKGERDVMYPARINSLIESAATGRAVWGSRTLSLDSDFRQIGSRRLFMFVEKSVFNATQWVAFESIGAGLFSRIRLTLVGFLLGLFNDGYFAGGSADEAFFVIVDATNNPPAQQEAGLVVVDVGIAPQNPAEFVHFRFQRKTLGA